MSNSQPAPLPIRLSAARARAIAEGRWGTGGTQAQRTNTRGAYYYACSGHGGYVVDGAVLTAEQRAQIDRLISPERVIAVVRDTPAGERVDVLTNPFSRRGHRYQVRPGQVRVEHPIYLFEEDDDFYVLEHYTPIRRLWTAEVEGYEAGVERYFENRFGERVRQLEAAERSESLQTTEGSHAPGSAATPRKGECDVGVSLG